MTDRRSLSTNEAAEYIGLSPTYLKQARMTGPRARRLDAPQHTNLGCRKVVYLREDLDAWLDAHRARTIEAA